MSQLRPPGALDVVRLTRSTVPETVEALVEFYQQDVPNFSYDPVRKVARACFSGDLSIDAAVRSVVLASKSDLGKRLNAEVAQIIGEHAEGRTATCYALPRETYLIHRDIKLPVVAPFYFVERGRATVFYLQPRKTTRLTSDQRALLVALLGRSYLKGDFADVGLEMLDCSNGSGSAERCPRAYGLADVASVSDAELQAAMERFAQAFETVRGMGVSRPERRQSRSQVDVQADLFI